MIRQILRLLPCCLILVAPLATLRAQSKPAADANTAAYELYASGNYQAAADAYAKILKDFPTDGIVPSVQMQLAFSYFFLGQFDQAQAILTKLTSGPALSPEVKQIADSLLPQILLAKAGTLAANDPKRTAAYNEAATKFGEYISKYPSAPDLESAIYSKAVAEYQIQKYADVVKDLEQNLQKFPQSSTIASSKNLLAITYATEGSQELNKGDSADKAKAFGLYKKAIDQLQDIINGKRDIAIINEAQFQLGEILLNQAGHSPEADRPALYQQALDAFRAVAPKEQIIEWQQELIQGFPEKRRQAIQSRNENLRKQLERDNERELKKLAELQAKPDQTATALLKMAEIFFQQGKNNQARVVLNHVNNFLKEEDDKKRALYFTAMTYALQNVADRAPSLYNEFTSKYKGDPLADNLPVVMGNMYLNLNQPADAIGYFDQSLAMYPDGRFVGLSVVSKASAEKRLGKVDDAMRTFQSFLAKNPPPEIGVIAQSELAGIYKDTQKWDDAIAAFKTVKDKYPGTPQATDADYWIGICTQAKGDNAAAAPMLDAFVKANPKNPLAPLALYAKGGAQIATGQKEEGIATLAAVAEQYPDSQPAPFTYFMRAQLRGQEGKADDVIALMKQFIEKYPKDDKVYFAYDSIAQTAVNAGKVDDALAAYREFAEKYPESAQAGEAMFKSAELQRAKAEAIGRYGALNEQERSQWKTLMDGSIATSEEMIKKYPDSPALALNLQTLLNAQRMLLTAELKKAPDVEKYFQALADSASTPAAKSKIIFALANYVSEQDAARSLALMTEAYKPDIIFSPQDIDFYGGALIGQKKFDEAAEVFKQLAAHYPIPPNVPPNAAPQQVQEAQAISLFGTARIAQEKGETAEAGKLFEQLKALYPWSPKVLEADYGIAQSLRQQKKLNEATTLLTAIIRNPNGSSQLRANAYLLGGDVMEDQMNAATDPKMKQEFMESAIDYYLKIPEFFAGVPKVAAEGLWKGAQLIEQQVAASTDPKFKAEQLGKAKAAYQQLMKDYPNSEYAPKAQERLNALGAQ
jgi:TolA-binding protein